MAQLVTDGQTRFSDSRWQLLVKMALIDVLFLEDYFLPLVPLNMIKRVYRCLGLRGSVPILSARDE
jgi:hypothetical protein